MRIINLLSCLSLTAALAACGPSGHYDENGSYMTPSEAQHYHDASDRSYDMQDRGYVSTDSGTYPVVPVYGQRGYYDYYGNYVTMDTNVGIPQNMMPPPGLCRVWMPDRDISRQPGIESCSGIKTRVPMGAYVIYGG